MSSNKPSLILHIGTEKTGTTSIQEFLYINAPSLLSRNIFIPGFLGKRNHRWLSVMAMNKCKIDGFILRSGLANSENDRMRAIESKIHELTEKAHEHSDKLWIVSSEHLQSRLRSYEEVAVLKNILKPLFNKIKILVYLRDPLETAVSSWSTGVKCGSTQNRFLSPQEKRYDSCNHMNIIRRWERSFERYRLDVRLYKRSELLGGCLLEDFCHASGISHIDSLKPPSRNNSILSYQALKYLAYINTKLLERDDCSRRRVRELITRHLDGGLFSFPRYCPNRIEAELYRSYYSESDEWVRSNYFPDKEFIWDYLCDDSGESRSLSVIGLSSSEKAIADTLLEVTCNLI